MGKVIDSRYQVLKKIGEGGMGVVYLAEDMRLERQVAIKRLQLLGKASDLKMFQKRFEREAKEMARFQHTNIVSVYDYGQDDEGVYLVLEYMPGGSLSQRMKQGHIAIDEAIEILQPLTEALQALHERELVHRDIKPSNILFDAWGKPKLSDFGVVKLVQGEESTALTATGTTVGTPEYMAPELIGGEVIPASDQYALGVVFYQMVTGQVPFEGRTPMETLFMQQTKKLPDPRTLNPELPNWVFTFLRVCLWKEPENRYENMQEFSRALTLKEKAFGETAFVPISPDEAEKNTPLQLPHLQKQKKGKRPWMAWGIAGAALIGLLLLSVLTGGFENWFQSDDETDLIEAAVIMEDTIAPTMTITETATITMTATPEVLLEDLKAQVFQLIGAMNAQYQTDAESQPLVLDAGMTVAPGTILTTGEDTTLLIGIGTGMGQNHKTVLFANSELMLSLENGFSATLAEGTVMMQPISQKAHLDLSSFDTAYAAVEEGSMVVVAAPDIVTIDCYAGTCVFFDQQDDFSPDIIPVGQRRIFQRGAESMSEPEEIPYEEQWQRNIECDQCLTEFIPTPTPTATPTATRTRVVHVYHTVTPTQKQQPAPPTRTPKPDSDGDGVPDEDELCDFDPNKTQPGICGCGTSDVDSDGDSMPDCNDQCDADPNKTAPGLCGCGTADTDSDGDGTPNCNDNCASDPFKTNPGVCGCGTADTDSDNDGTPNCNDNCASDPFKTEPGICGCGTADTDSDGDGSVNCIEECDDDPNKTQPGICGCGVSDVDSDNDHTPDCNDLCPNDRWKTHPGWCGCGELEIDSDGDLIPDCEDDCPLDPDRIRPPCGLAEELGFSEEAVDYLFRYLP